MHLTKHGVHVDWEDMHRVGFDIDRDMHELNHLGGDTDIPSYINSCTKLNMRFEGPVISDTVKDEIMLGGIVRGVGPAKFTTRKGWVIIQPNYGPLRMTISWVSPLDSWLKVSGRYTDPIKRMQNFKVRKDHGYYCSEIDFTFEEQNVSK